MNVEQIFANAGVNVAVLGNATEPKPTLEARKEEAKKLVSALEAGAITVGAIVKHVTSFEGHKLAQQQFYALSGFKPSQNSTEPKAKPVAKAVAQATDGVTITREQHQFFTLLLEATKRVAPELINTVMESMQQQKLKEAEERIKAELLASMGSVANLIKDVEPTITPTEVEYSDELRAKANRVIEDLQAGKKVPPMVADAAKCVLSNVSITEEAEKRLEAIKL